MSGGSHGYGARPAPAVSQSRLLRRQPRLNARGSTVSCIVRNFNDLGARIEFDGTALLPDLIDFLVERKGIACRARIVWRRPDEAGLIFSDACDGNAVVPLDWARRLRASERANRRLQLRIEQLRSEH